MIAIRALMAREEVKDDLRPGLGPPKGFQLRSPPVCAFLSQKLLKGILHVRIRLVDRSRGSGEIVVMTRWDGEEDEVEVAGVRNLKGDRRRQFAKELESRVKEKQR